MTTFADLIADVEADLYSFTQGNDQVSWLTSAMTSTNTTINVNDAASFGVGYAEITSSLGNELIYIASKDEQANTITVPPWGRAQRGTSAYAHPANARIAASPQFPRYKIAQYVNESVSDTYPALFRVATVDVPLQTRVAVYSLPADVEGLVDAQVSLDDNPELGWEPLRRMRFMQSDHTLVVGEVCMDNQTLRVTYRCPPKPFAALTDTLDDIGFSDSMRSVVRLGAYYKSLTGLQGQTLQVSSVDSAAMVQLRQPDYLNNALKTVFAQYQIALQAQADRLRDLYPPLRYRIV